MIESKVQCPVCKGNINFRYHTFWMCGLCGTKYHLVQGIPKLYIEDYLGKADKRLRDSYYNTLLGKFNNFTQAFITIPVRPLRISLIHWLVYILIVCFLGFLVHHCVEWIAIRGLKVINLVDFIILFLLTSFILFFAKYPNYAGLLFLALPVKISLSIRRFKPLTSHPLVHKMFQKEYLNSGDRLKILDVATGSCHSLFRNGWMTLSADYTAVDLSEKMLMQGKYFMSSKGVPVDFILCDATRLPFESDTFDIVTCYGAVNGYDDPKNALAEMVRVTKKGGKILFLDELEYKSASWVEHLYFKHVLTFYNTIVGCPIQLLPDQLEDVQVHQVYEFIYICTARKKR